MKINQHVVLGINAVNTLKGKTGPTRTEDLAKEIGASVHFLDQVMRKLRQANIVSVKRGPGGGYSLNPLYGKLTAYDVASAVGRDFGTVKFDTAPTSRLHKSIVDAFMSVNL
jgi:Rrf2 family iron-sulfur cluster assembly transcriptional regulator